MRDVEEGLGLFLRASVAVFIDGLARSGRWKGLGGFGAASARLTPYVWEAGIILVRRVARGGVGATVAGPCDGCG